MLPVPGFAQSVKIMSWNTLNYPGSTGPQRNDDFQAVISAVAPDVLVCQEIRDDSGSQAFLNGVLNVIDPGEWSLAPFTNGFDSDNALYYRSNLFTVADFGWLNTTPRETDWWRLRPAGNLTGEGDIVLYSCHLKASNTSADAEDRRVAARAIRDHMIATWDEGVHVMVMGDFNIYTSSENAYLALTANPIEPAQMFDPIATPGSWNNNATYASVHTQSTRTTQLSDGGSSGGMDDRFDFILIDEDLGDTESWDYVSGSYQAYGQDGLHFNSSVNSAPTNAAVGQALADNLYNASDHLPVILELQTPARAQLLPTDVAFGQVLVGESAAEALQLRNAVLAGADELDFGVTTSAPLTLGGATAGELAPGQVAAIQVILDTSTAGPIVDPVTVTTDDPVNPSIEVNVTGRVVRPSRPSWDAQSDSLVLPVATPIPNDEVTEIVVEAHNAGYDADQAGLYVTGASFSGPDASFFSLVDPAAFFVRETPVQRRIEVDGTGLADGTVLEATLTFTTQDEFLVQGAQPRASLVVDFQLEIDDGTTAAPPAISRTTLHPPVPSPFNPRTTISFDLARSGPARVEVFDVRGRLVSLLVDETLGAGRHSRVWEAEDASGAPLASGVYLVRLRAADTVEVRRAVLLR